MTTKRAAPTILYKRFAAEGVIGAAYKNKNIAILRINSGFIRCIYRCFEVCDVRTHSIPSNFSSITGFIALRLDFGLFDENRPDVVSPSKSSKGFLAALNLAYRASTKNH